MTLRLGILASHTGSNANSIIQACNNGIIDAQVTIIISNNRNSFILSRGKQYKIPSFHLLKEQDILQSLRDHNVDLIILAGYMKKIGHKILDAYSNRILNIHPSLLPQHGGKGMYGLAVHQAVLDAGDEETGVTIHLVNEEYDEGTILAQERIRVEESDTVETLSRRVLKVEHKLYPETIGRISRGLIKLKQEKKKDETIS